MFCLNKFYNKEKKILIQEEASKFSSVLKFRVNDL